MENNWMSKMKRSTTLKQEVTIPDYNYKKKTPIKGRSLITYQNKLKRLKRRYIKLFENSTKQKQKDNGELPRNKKGYFCDNYSTVENYIKNYFIKESNNKK